MKPLIRLLTKTSSIFGNKIELSTSSLVLFDFLGTVKAAPHEWVTRTGQP